MTPQDSRERPLLFLGTTNLDVVCFADDLPQRGESVMGVIERFAGGKGANQAVCAGKLGSEPLFATLLGDDDAGALLKKALLSAGVQGDAVVTAPRMASGTALIFVDRSGNNMIGIDTGANVAFGPGHVDDALRLTPPSAVLVAEMGLPEGALRHLFRTKGERLLIFNPAPVTGHLSPDDCAAIDILTPNEIEAEALTGIGIKTLDDARAAATMLVERGCRSVVVTLGDVGSICVDADHQRFVPAFPVDAVDTTAAGDAFNGGLATAIARNMPMEDAIRFATAVAALSVKQKGAQSSMPRARDVTDFLEQMDAGT